MRSKYRSSHGVPGSNELELLGWQLLHTWVVRPTNLYPPGPSIPLMHLCHIVETVDAPDELNVPRAPWRIRTDAVHVALDSFMGRRVIPRQRQPDGATRHDKLIRRGQVAVQAGQQIGRLGHREHRGIE